MIFNKGGILDCVPLFFCMQKLSLKYYLNPDVVYVAKNLLGKVLCTQINQVTTKAIICETEAYAGVNDKASHAYGNKFTDRTKTMYLQGGIAYVYLCYGIHHLFNVVTNIKGVPHAVLIRGGIPLSGIPEIMKRKDAHQLKTKDLIGPGKLSKALGISTALNQTSLIGPSIWLEDHQINIHPKIIEIGKRIGVNYAQEDANLPYRFWFNPEAIQW